MLNLKKLLTKALDEIHALQSPKTATSSYVQEIVTNLGADWANYPTGFSANQIRTSGPYAMGLIYKYNDSYGSVIIYSYHRNFPMPVFVRKFNGVWVDPIELR